MFKKFFTKQALKFKGVPAEQADMIAEQLEKNPALLQALEDPKIKKFLEKISAEIEQKSKMGMDQNAIMMSLMRTHKDEVMKYRDVLMPLMSLMQK